MTKYLLCGLLLAMSLKVVAQPDKSFAQVALYPNLAVVTLDKSVEADQMIVTVFYRQPFTADLTTTTTTVMLTRSVVDVQPAFSGTGVAIKSVEDPSTVQFVRIELVKNAGRMDWTP